MRSALIIIALLLHELTFAGTSIAPEKPSGKAVNGARPPQIGAAATHMKFQSQHEAVRLNTARTPAPLKTAPTPAVVQDAREGEGLPGGTLLAALALMIAIAVRRSSAEKP